MMLGENGGLKGRALRAGEPVSALDPAILTQRRVLMSFRAGCVRHTGCHFYFARRVTFQPCADNQSPSWASKFLDEWCYQVMRSRIEPMKKIARTLRSHRALILNYFRARKQFSSGVVEGLNNKAKLTMRKSYGFRTFHVTEIALYHALGRLPEPDVAHRFF